MARNATAALPLRIDFGDGEDYHEQCTGYLTVAAICFAVLHFLAGLSWRGHGRGVAIQLFRNVIPVFVTAALLILSMAAVLYLFFYRLAYHPASAGSKSELIVIAIGLMPLFWTGVLGTDRRRRLVAAKLASTPCFGNGPHAANHQKLPRHGSIVSFHFDEQHGTAQTHEALRAEPASPENSPSAPPPKSSPSASPSGASVGLKSESGSTGLTRKKIWEFTCRSSATWVLGRSKRQAWPLNVVRTYRTRGKRFLLIKDHTVQDGAGAALLDPTFTHSRGLDKSLLGRVVLAAVYRAAPCVLHSWNRKFEAKLLHRFARVPAVRCMLRGDLRRSLDNSETADELLPDKCYLSEVLWAVVMVESLDYLQRKRRDVPMLTWLTGLPRWLCENDADEIDVEIDAMFETWKIGRVCGRTMTKPCDSECCCHNEALCSEHCGCRCPCVCDCV